MRNKLTRRKFLAVSATGAASLMLPKIPAFADEVSRIGEVDYFLPSTPNDLPPLPVLYFEEVSDEKEITLDDILKKLNFGLDPEDWLTELPFSKDIVIPEPGNNTLEEPEHFYPDEMTEEEIAIVIKRIANGENVIFGDGVGYDYAEYLEDHPTRSSSPTRWLSGGTNKTHQWLAVRAAFILTNDYSSMASFFTYPRVATMTSNADWPDDNEKTDIFSWHFYHHPTGTNYWWHSSPTAKSKFIDWYTNAYYKYINAGINASTQLAAFADLGEAIHYLSDIGAPPHTGDRAFFGSGGLGYDAGQAYAHHVYEVEADNRKLSQTVNNAYWYSWYVSNTLSYAAENNAMISNGYYQRSNYYSNTAQDFDDAISFPLEFTQKDIAGLLYRFYYDVHSPFGNYEGASGGVGSVSIAGWAFDYDATSTAIQMHVYIGGPAGSANPEVHVYNTNAYRPDVNNVYGISGNHGFDYTIYTSRQGLQPVYVYAINVGTGSNTCLGYKYVVVSSTPSYTPWLIGNYEGASGGAGIVSIAGWGFDNGSPQTVIQVHVYIGGTYGSPGVEGYAYYTNAYRPDVNSYYGLTGNHGFEYTISTSKRGYQPVYVFLIEAGGNGNAMMGPKTVYIS